MESGSSEGARFGALVEIGDLVGGRYRVQRAVGGEGGVVRASHVHLDQPVALRFTRADLAEHHPELCARFVRDARAAARLRSEHAARVLDVDTLEDGTAFVAMEHLEGTDLAEAMRRAGPLPVADAALYALMASHAIAEAHVRGIVHQDVRPENLFLVTAPEGTPSVKVLGFAIGPLLDGADPGFPMRAFGSLPRSPLMSSPEQLVSPAEVDARTDVWGLGVTLYRLLTGVDAFEAPTPEHIVARVLHEAPPSPAELRRAVPVALGQVVLRCLRKEREDRYADVAELAWALAPFAAGEGQRYAERIAAIREGADALSARWMRGRDASSRAVVEAPIALDEGVVASHRRPVLKGIVTVAMLAAASLGVAGLLHDRARGGAFSTKLGIAERPIPVAAALTAVAPAPTAAAPAPEPPRPTEPAPDVAPPAPPAHVGTLPSVEHIEPKGSPAVAAPPAPVAPVRVKPPPRKFVRRLPPRPVEPRVRPREPWPPEPRRPEPASSSPPSFDEPVPPPMDLGAPPAALPPPPPEPALPPDYDPL